MRRRQQIAAVLPSVNVGSGDEYFQWRVARACAHAGKAGADANRAMLHRDDGIRDAEAEIVMRVNAALRLGFQHSIVGLEARRGVIHRHRAAGVCDVHVVCAIGLHQFRLRREQFGRDHVMFDAVLAVDR